MAAMLLPLAAVPDWIEGILPVLFLLVWVISQVRNLFGNAAGRAPPQRPAPRPAPRPPAADPAGDLARQIDEFLRRSTGGPPVAAAPGKPRDRGEQPRRRQQPSRTSAGPPALPRPRAAKPAAPPPAAPPHELGSLGGHATDVDRHVRDAFAREIEHLPAGTAATAAAASARPAPPAAALAAALRDPAALRQLVVLRELLDRPVDRW